MIQIEVQSKVEFIKYLLLLALLALSSQIFAYDYFEYDEKDFPQRSPLSNHSCSSPYDENTYLTVLYEIANCNFESGNNTKALEIFDLLLNKYPYKGEDQRTQVAYADIYKTRGAINFNLQNYARSIQDFQSSLNLHPDDMDAIIKLSHSFDKIGDDQNAVKYLFVAIEKYSGNHSIKSTSDVIGYHEEALYQYLIDLSERTKNFDKIESYLESRIQNNYGSKKLFEIIVDAFKRNGYLDSYKLLTKKYCDFNSIKILDVCLSAKATRASKNKKQSNN